MKKIIFVSDIEWDTDDGYDGKNQELTLPAEIEIPVSELLFEDETQDDIDMEEIEDRVADYLSDQYGFCVYGFHMNSITMEE